MRHGRIRLHRTLSHRGRNARHRPRRPRFAVARRQARAVHHSGRHAHDADAAVLRPLPRDARRQGGGARLPGGARHAPADGRRRALAPRRRARRRRPRRRFADHEPRMGGPRDVRHDRRDFRGRDPRAVGRPARAAGDGGAQPAHLRLRPDHHLRAGVSARGRRLLGRQQVFLPRHRRRRRHQFHALAGRAHHELRDHRQRLHAGARRHRSRRVDGDGADRLLRARRHHGRPRRPLLRLGARSVGARVGAVVPAAHRLARHSRCARCSP